MYPVMDLQALSSTIYSDSLKPYISAPDTDISEWVLDIALRYRLVIMLHIVMVRGLAGVAL